MSRGMLWLVPNTLDLGTEPGPIDDVLPLGVLRRAAALTHWVVEDARSARAFLKRVQAVVPLARPLQELQIAELPRPRKGSAEPVPPTAWQALLAPAREGHDIGLLSEAGLPAVADPGAALLALAASGLNGQSFAFVGYLPQDGTARSARIRELETLSRRLGQTQLAIETPYRNEALLASLVGTLAPTTRLAVSCGLTLAGGFTRSDTVSGWRAKPAALPDRWPAVFGWLAG
jgi:16S rRNA (cytidine1402-2'-O)-methyltransferase